MFAEGDEDETTFGSLDGFIAATGETETVEDEEREDEGEEDHNDGKKHNDSTGKDEGEGTTLTNSTSLAIMVKPTSSETPSRMYRKSLLPPIPLYRGKRSLHRVFQDIEDRVWREKEKRLEQGTGQEDAQEGRKTRNKIGRKKRRRMVLDETPTPTPAEMKHDTESGEILPVVRIDDATAVKQKRQSVGKMHEEEGGQDVVNMHEEGEQDVGNMYEEEKVREVVRMKEEEQDVVRRKEEEKEEHSKHSVVKRKIAEEQHVVEAKVEEVGASVEAKVEELKRRRRVMKGRDKVGGVLLNWVKRNEEEGKRGGEEEGDVDVTVMVSSKLVSSPIVKDLSSCRGRTTVVVWKFSGGEDFVVGMKTCVVKRTVKEIAKGKDAAEMLIHSVGLLRRKYNTVVVVLQGEPGRSARNPFFHLVLTSLACLPDGVGDGSEPSKVRLWTCVRSEHIFELVRSTAIAESRRGQSLQWLGHLSLTSKDHLESLSKAGAFFEAMPRIGWPLALSISHSFDNVAEAVQATEDDLCSCVRGMTRNIAKSLLAVFHREGSRL